MDENTNVPASDVPASDVPANEGADMGTAAAPVEGEATAQ